MERNRTIVIVSLKIPYPNMIELSFGNLLGETAYSEAIVSMLQKQAAKRRIYQMDKVLILLISCASLTRSL